MKLVAPEGSVYQAGTLSGNPVAVSAGIATLTTLMNKNIYSYLETLSSQLEQGLLDTSKKAKVNLTINRFGSMLTTFFTNKAICNFRTASQSDTKRYAKFFWNMIKCGIYCPPSQFEAVFLSYAHAKEDVENTIRASYKVFKAI